MCSFFSLSKPTLCVEMTDLGVDMAPLSFSSQHYRDLPFLMSAITASLVWVMTAFFLPLPLPHACSVHMPGTRRGWRMPRSAIPHLIPLRQGLSLCLELGQQPEVPRDSPVSSHYPRPYTWSIALGLWACMTSYSVFTVDAKDSDSDSHACTANCLTPQVFSSIPPLSM